MRRLLALLLVAGVVTAVGCKPPGTSTSKSTGATPAKNAGDGEATKTPTPPPVVPPAGESKETPKDEGDSEDGK